MRMTLTTRALIIAGAYFIITALALHFVPNPDGFDVLAALSGTIGAVGTLVTYYIFRREPNRKNSFIFLNFGFFFILLAISPHASVFSRLFNTFNQYSSFFTFQYLTSVFYFVLTAAIGYLVIDTLFREAATIVKYGVVLGLVGLLFVSYFSPIYLNSKYLYATSDIKDFSTISRGIKQLEGEGVKEITPELVANRISLPAWRGEENIGTLHEAAEINRIRQVAPYFEGNNFVLLVYKPLFLAVTYMNVACVFLILLFFGYQYRKDPPQGAYIEKIAFVFLPYASLEILHNYGYVLSIEFDIYVQLHNVGLYLTLANLLLILLFFSLRLSFISSIKGEFYEQELVSDFEHISRWRDSIDNLVVRYFLDPKTFHGRLLAPREAKSKA